MLEQICSEEEMLKWLKSQMKRLGISRKTLAILCEVEERTVYKWLSSESRLPARAIVEVNKFNLDC